MEQSTKNWTFHTVSMKKSVLLVCFPAFLGDFDAISILEALRILLYCNWLNFVLKQSF